MVYAGFSHTKFIKNNVVCTSKKHVKNVLSQQAHADFGIPCIPVVNGLHMGWHDRFRRTVKP